MTDPKPWSVDGAPAGVRELLVAARAEQPDRAGAERALVALGVGAGISASAHAAAGAILGGVPATKGAATVGGLGFAIKWGLIGALGAVATFGVAHGVGLAVDAIATPAPAERGEPDVRARAAGQLSASGVRVAAPSEPRPVTRPGSSLPAPVAVAAVAAGSATAETRSAPSAPAAVSGGSGSADVALRANASHPPLASDAPTNSGSSSGSVPAGGDTAESRRRMTEEVAAVDRARALLRGGDVQGTLAALDAYAARFPDRRFEPEALYLRMEASRRAGDAATARATATELVRLFPTAPQAAPARAVLTASH